MYGHCVASVVREPTHELEAVHGAFFVETDEKDEIEQVIEDLAGAWEEGIERRLLADGRLRLRRNHTTRENDMNLPTLPSDSAAVAGASPCGGCACPAGLQFTWAGIDQVLSVYTCVPAALAPGPGGGRVKLAAAMVPPGPDCTLRWSAI